MVCKYCGMNGLEWVRDEDAGNWVLTGADGSVHRCRARLRGSGRIDDLCASLEGLTASELTGVVAAAMRVLVDRAAGKAEANSNTVTATTSGPVQAVQDADLPF